MSESAPTQSSQSFPRGMALLVAGAFFMEILDATIITPAIPRIADSFGVAAVDVNVAISAYMNHTRAHPCQRNRLVVRRDRRRGRRGVSELGDLASAEHRGTTGPTMAFSGVDGDNLTHGNTLNAAVQELAAGLGIAVGALLLSLLTSYPYAYLVLGALLAVTLVETLRLPRDAGSHLSGRPATVFGPIGPFSQFGLRRFDSWIDVPSFRSYSLNN